MSTVIESLEKRDLKQRPKFGAGDRVRVHFQVVEGNRKRTQVFEGIVIKRQGSGVRETFTVRKQSFGVGVERTFPLHSPKIEKLEIAARGDVRRAKLYYLRDKVGKSARVAERRWGIEDDVLVAEDEAEAVDAEGVAVSEAEPEAVEAPEQEGEATEGEGDGEQPAAETDEPADQAEEQPDDQAEEQPARDADGDEAEANHEPEPEATADASPEKAED